MAVVYFLNQRCDELVTWPVPLDGRGWLELVVIEQEKMNLCIYRVSLSRNQVLIFFFFCYKTLTKKVPQQIEYSIKLKLILSQSTTRIN